MTMCGGCGREWTGKSTCHCGSCHETFSGVTVFDHHQELTDCFPGVVCRDPEGRGLQFDEHARGGGVWRRELSAGGLEHRRVSTPPSPPSGGSS